MIVFVACMIIFLLGCLVIHMFQTNASFLNMFVYEVLRTHLKDTISMEQADELWMMLQKLCMNGLASKDQMWKRLQGVLCLCVQDTKLRLVIETALQPSFMPSSSFCSTSSPSLSPSAGTDWQQTLNKMIMEDPDACVCPITLDNLLVDRCILDKDVAGLKSPGGRLHLFRHSALKRWFSMGSTKNPLTNCVVDPLRDVWVLS